MSYTLEDPSFTIAREKAMSDLEIIMSPLRREISGDGSRIQLDIFRGEDDPGWIPEVVDEENASTVRDDPFDTDRESSTEEIQR